MTQPLEGEQVLDLTQIYLGPYCGMMLSYLGADVIKVEPPGGDTLRYRSESGVPPEVQFVNPSKRSVSLDLKTTQGKEVFKELVAESDILIENFRTGKMADLGLGYDDLKQINPELVYGHASGYGDSGPYRDHPAVDLIIQAVGGMMISTGFPDGPPVKAGPAVSDFHAGNQLALGVMSALLQREQTGHGQYIEVGMHDSLYPMLASPIASWVNELDVPPRTGNRHSGLSVTPYNAYETEDGYIAIAAVSETQWQNLTLLMGHPDLADPDGKMGTKAKRAEHIDEIDDLIQDWVEGKRRDDVVETLRDAEVPCAPVQTIEEIVTDPQLAHRDMLNYLPNQNSQGRDEVPVPGMPIKFSRSDNPEIEQAPTLGQHTRDVLTELGYSPDEIKSLFEAEVLFDGR